MKEAFPTLTQEQVKKLQSKLFAIGCKAKRNAENLCNIPNYNDQRDAIRMEVNKVCAKFGINFDFTVQGDPRGYCFKIILPTSKYNTWGGSEDGWGFGD